MSRFGNGSDKYVELLATQDITSGTAVKSSFINAALTHWVTFLLPFGSVDGDDVVITIDACTANATSGASLAAIPFRYRLSGAVTADTWGAVTTADSAGCTLTSTSQHSSLMLIDIDPADIVCDTGSSYDTYKYLRVVLDGGGSLSHCLITVVAAYEPRYRDMTVTSS